MFPTSDTRNERREAGNDGAQEKETKSRRHRGGKEGGATVARLLAIELF